MPAIVLQVKKAERTMESPREQSTVPYVNTTKEYTHHKPILTVPYVNTSCKTHPKPISNPISSRYCRRILQYKKEQTFDPVEDRSHDKSPNPQGI